MKKCTILKLSIFLLFISIFINNTVEGAFSLQQNKISGIVNGKDGKPMAGVNVKATGTTVGALTDADGKYSMEVPSGTKTLTFSFIGMETQVISIGTSTQINATMAEAAIGLDEVVVVGYGTQKKLNLTGAVDVVSGDVLQNRASANVGVLLQGASPNLNIMVSSFGGEPGASPLFNIRGIGSLTSGGGTPLILVDGVEMNINNLDPETVENVTVLKDAASAAIYGSRAPFGVVIVTTKKGTKNKGISINYSNNIAVASPMNLPAWQSSLRYVTAYNQSLENSGQPDKFLPPQIERIKAYIAGTYTPEYDTVNPPHSIWAGRHQGNANYEWWDEYWKDHTINQKHNINISGGDDNTQYYVSAGYYDQGTSFNYADEYYKRYNVLANLTSQATKWLRFNLNTKYSNTKSKHPNAGSDWDPGRTFFISEMIKFFPTTPKYNVDGTVNNPYVNALMKAGPATGNENDLFIGLGAELEPVTGWKTNFNYNYNYTGNKYTWLDSEIWVEIPDGQVVNFWNDPNYYTQNWESNNYNSMNVFTSYEKTIQRHFFKGMVGYEREYRYFSSLYGYRTALISEEVPSISTATGVYSVDDAMSHWATEAFFGRLNYNYMEKYLFEVNARYNGSSRFAKDSRWGFFPSVSVGYNISKESFWEPLLNTVNNFKIRGSYGSLGNQNVSNYLYLSNIPINTELEWIIGNERPLYAGVPNIISPTLTWESVNTLDLGADANFLHNRLGLVFDWFERNTLNMFGPATILPASLGTTPPLENNASLTTKGWEISLGWNDRIQSDFSYSLRLTLADSKSTVSKYLNLTGQIDEYYVGREIGEIWGYTSDGLIQSEDEVIPDQSFFYNKWGPGDIKYKDLNDDGKIDDGSRTLADHGDLKVIGNTSPRYSIGFSGAITWKNFDFSMFWQGILKRDLMPSSNMWWGVGTRGDNGGAFYQGHDDYWRPADETNLFGPNTDAYYAKPYVTTETYKNQQTQTRYLLHPRYFRLKNIQLGYTIPKKLTEKIRIEALKFTLSGENLITIDDLPPYIDPETSFESSQWMLGAIYPLSKSVSVGINITF
jgi:TonB-linked SusC/RagA family outer membrane protein